MKEDLKPSKKTNFPELEEEDEEDDEEQDLETLAKYCPYLQARSFFERFFPKNATLEYLENFHKNHPIQNIYLYPILSTSKQEKR